jgi:hypothetical protein
MAARLSQDLAASKVFLQSLVFGEFPHGQEEEKYETEACSSKATDAATLEFAPRGNTFRSARYL